jgi:hypothetical protein
MKTLVSTIVITQDYITFHRNVGSPSIFLHPTDASLDRLETLIRSYHITAWLTKISGAKITLFIHTNQPLGGL